MIKSNLLLALRHLQRNKLYTAINIFGLAIGIAACIVIFLIANFELGFDSFRQDRDRIFRVYTSFSGAFSGLNPGVPTAVEPYVKEKVSGIAHSTMFFTESMQVSPLNVQGKPMDEIEAEDLVIVDPEYFSVFSDYQWLGGDPNSALAEPHQVVLSDEKAERYFGGSNPLEAIGRKIMYGDSTVMMVTGIVKAPPIQSDLYFNDFISMATTVSGDWKNSGNYERDNLNSTSSRTQLFIKLLQDKSPDEITPQFAKLEERQLGQGGPYAAKASFLLQPLTDLHFNVDMGIFDYSRSPAHLPTLYALIGVALLLLIIGAINFVNLETAQAIRRAKEVGVRKVLGGSRGNLIGQFLGQTLVITSLAMMVALFLTEISLWYFSDFIPSDLEFRLFDPMTLLFVLSTVILVALLAGTYPAFVLSAFRPALALKDRIGAFGKRGGANNLRRGLVVFQFVIAQVLIFGTLATGYQIRYMMDKDMGFKKDAIVYFRTPFRDTQKRIFVLGEELGRMPQIQAVTLHDSPPTRRGWNTTIMAYGQGDDEQSYEVHTKFGDANYLDMYDIPLLAGREPLPSDTVKEMLINRTFAQQLGFEQPDEAIGQMINYSEVKVPVVGVVEDFHVQSLHQPIKPTAIFHASRSFHSIGVQLPSEGKQLKDMGETMTLLETEWKKVFPEVPFEYEFLDETVANFYETEQRTTKLINTATFIAILISCLGLFGLVSFSANQRTKEIGVRKVLGATVRSIVALLSREFLLLVLIAFLLAAPIGWWLTNRWLGDFAYTINLSWWLFALCGALAVFVAFGTMSIQAIRAALDNPVDSLRSE